MEKSIKDINKEEAKLKAEEETKLNKRGKKFVLKSGDYVDEKGNKFKEGDIIRCRHNLCEKFKNKFEEQK